MTVKGHPTHNGWVAITKKTGTMTRDTERVNIFGVNYGNEVSGPGAWREIWPHTLEPTKAVLGCAAHCTPHTGPPNESALNNSFLCHSISPVLAISIQKITLVWHFPIKKLSITLNGNHLSIYLSIYCFIPNLSTLSLSISIAYTSIK